MSWRIDERANKTGIGAVASICQGGIAAQRWFPQIASFFGFLSRPFCTTSLINVWDRTKKNIRLDANIALTVLRLEKAHSQRVLDSYVKFRFWTVSEECVFEVVLFAWGPLLLIDFEAITGIVLNDTYIFRSSIFVLYCITRICPKITLIRVIWASLGVKLAKASRSHARLLFYISAPVAILKRARMSLNVPSVWVKLTLLPHYFYKIFTINEPLSLVLSSPGSSKHVVLGVYLCIWSGRGNIGRRPFWKLFSIGGSSFVALSLVRFSAWLDRYWVFRLSSLKACPFSRACILQVNYIIDR